MATKSKIFHFLTDEIAVWMLSFIGGFVDAAGYIILHGLFTSSITGNLVVACASIYQPEGVFCRFLVSLCFAFGSGTMTSIGVRVKVVEEVHPKLTAMILFGFEFAAFFLCLVLGLVYGEEINNSTGLDNGSVILLGAMMGFSMGVHNGAAKETIPNCPSTTVMTMTLVTMSGHASNAFNYSLAKHSLLQMHPRSSHANANTIDQKFNESWTKFSTTIKPLIMFLLGAVTGAASMANWKFWCMLIPMGVVSIKLGDIYTSYRREGDPKEDVKIKDESNQVDMPLPPSPVPMQNTVGFNPLSSSTTSQKSETSDDGTNTDSKALLC